MASASVYPHYIAKAEKKGRTKAEVHAIIHWLTGYDERALQQVLDKQTDFETFPLRRDATSSHRTALHRRGPICRWIGQGLGNFRKRIADPVRSVSACAGQCGTNKDHR